MRVIKRRRDEEEAKDRKDEETKKWKGGEVKLGETKRMKR